MATLNIILYIMSSLGVILKVQLLNWIGLFLCIFCALYLMYMMFKGLTNVVQKSLTFRLANTFLIMSLNILSILFLF